MRAEPGYECLTFLYSDEEGGVAKDKNGNFRFIRQPIIAWWLGDEEERTTPRPITVQGLALGGKYQAVLCPDGSVKAFGGITYESPEDWVKLTPHNKEWLRWGSAVDDDDLDDLAAE
jgi:hypothetical protein